MAILLAVLGVLGIAAWLAKLSPPQPSIPSAAPAANGSNSASGEFVASAQPLIPVAPPTATNAGSANVPAGSKLEAEEFVRRRAEELNELAMETNSEAHQAIVLELKNPDRAIRQAALEALEQANDRSLVPQMQQIADQTDDAGEKQAILDAIDFINLPSLTEYLHQPQKK